MKKEDRINAAYTNEKAKHGNAIILFHIGNGYEAYYSDAETLAKLLPLRIYTVNKTISLVRFPEDELEQFTNRLVDAGHAICISEVRGTSGQHILESL